MTCHDSGKWTWICSLVWLTELVCMRAKNFTLQPRCLAIQGWVVVPPSCILYNHVMTSRGLYYRVLLLGSGQIHWLCKMLPNFARSDGAGKHAILAYNLAVPTKTFAGSSWLSHKFHFPWMKVFRYRFMVYNPCILLPRIWACWDLGSADQRP